MHSYALDEVKGFGKCCSQVWTFTSFSVTPFLLAHASALETSGDKKPEFAWHTFTHTLHTRQPSKFGIAPALETLHLLNSNEFQTSSITSSLHFPVHPLVPSHNAFSNRAHTVSVLRRMAFEVPQGSCCGRLGDPTSHQPYLILPSRMVGPSHG